MITALKFLKTIINCTHMVLTRQEKEKLVLDLYNQGKTYREIAKEARMSLRDIGVIVNKAVKEEELKTDHRNDKENQDTNNSAEKKLNEQELSLSTRAYKLFSKGKALVEVAVALNLEEAEVTRYYKEYLKLKQSHGLYLAYEETEGEIEPFLKLYELSKTADMDTKQVVNLLEIANNDLPALENRYLKLKNEVDHLEYRKANSNRTLQNLENQMVDSNQVLNSYRASCQEERLKLECLHQVKAGLAKLVRRFKRNNEEYLKIKKTVEEEVTRILLDGKGLLNLTFYSLMESIRKDPDKYRSLIYYNSVSSITGNGIEPTYDGAYAYGYQLQYPSYDSFFEAYKTMLLDDAEKLYKTLVTEWVNRIIAGYVSPNSSSTSSLLPSGKQEQSIRS
jgi:hypothetical protein